MALALLAGCGGDSATGPDKYPTVVGQWCAAGVHSQAVQDSPTAWTVTLYYNVSQTETYTGSDGIVRQREVRSCGTAVVVYTTAPADWTPYVAITNAGLDAGVVPIR